MLSLMQLLILSIMQGLTEFIPVSSSTHLAILPHLMHWQDQGLLIDVAVHFGTLIAAIIYFRRDFVRMTLGGVDLLRGRKTKDQQFFLQLTIATIPVVITGGILGAYLSDGVRLIGVMALSSIGFGLLLYIADRFSSTEKTITEMTYKYAFLAGLGQALAIIPGTSRSGSSMTVLRFLGFSRIDTAHYSYLMSIPTVIAASAWMAIKIFKINHIEIYSDVVIAAFLSFIAGYASIAFMMRWLERSTYSIFAIYRILLGFFLLVWFYWI